MVARFAGQDSDVYETSRGPAHTGLVMTKRSFAKEGCDVVEG